MHQSKHFVLLLQAALHQNLYADNIKGNRGEDQTDNNNYDATWPIIEVSARILFPLVHEGEHDIIDQFVSVIDLNNILKSEST